MPESDQVATRCPKCGTPGAFAAEEIGQAGRFVRCPRCRTTWLARNVAGDAFGRAGSFQVAPLRPPPPIIEGELARPRSLRTAPPRPRPAATQQPAPARPFVLPPPPFPPRPPSNRRLAALGLTLTILVLLGLAVPIGAAIPGLAKLFHGEARLAIEQVRSESLRRGGVDTIVVEGVLANHSRRDLAVPAIRISLRTNAGGEIYSWEVEPSTTRLDPGQSIGFRSALANPVKGADQIAVTLTERHPLTIGMR